MELKHNPVMPDFRWQPRFNRTFMELKLQDLGNEPPETLYSFNRTFMELKLGIKVLWHTDNEF